MMGNFYGHTADIGEPNRGYRVIPFAQEGARF
jgi:hypothetical protein